MDIAASWHHRCCELLRSPLRDGDDGPDDLVESEPEPSAVNAPRLSLYCDDAHPRVVVANMSADGEGTVDTGILRINLRLPRDPFGGARVVDHEGNRAIRVTCLDPGCGRRAQAGEAKVAAVISRCAGGGIRVLSLAMFERILGDAI
jgi:hypothetical protein